VGFIGVNPECVVYSIDSVDTIRHVELYYGIFGILPISGGSTHIDGVGLGNENFH